MDRRQGAALVSAGVNVGLVVIKVALATLSGSIALLADAWHSLSDVFVSLFVYAGFKFSGTSRRRVAVVENVVALVIGVIILGAGASILGKASVPSPRLVSNLGIAMAGTFLTIVVAYFLARYKLNVGTATGSAALVADGAHSRMDVYSSCAVLAGLLGHMIGLSLDKAAAVVVVFFIARAGFDVIGRAMQALAVGEMLDTARALDISGTWLGRVGRKLSAGFERLTGRRLEINLRTLASSMRPRRLLLVAVLGAVAVAIYLGSGFYTVAPDQRGVVLRLGRIVAVDVPPGLHWAWPRPVHKVVKYQKEFLRRVEVGFRLRMAAAAPMGDAYLWESRHIGGFYEKRVQEALMLTGDENIIDLNLVAQYRVAEPAAYLFHIASPESLVRAATEAVVRGVVSREPLEVLLTTDRRRIEQEVAASLQELLGGYGAGIDVISVRLQDVHPPVEVVSSFREVSSAREDKSRFMREAEAYANDELPKARGQAEQAMQEARRTLEQAVNRATGEAERFTKIVREYSKARDVTGDRLYLETIEQSLAGARKVVVDASLPPGGVDLRLLPPGLKEEPVPAQVPTYDQIEMERQLERMGMGVRGTGSERQP